MPSRRPPVFSELTQPALFLDVDGTLLPIQDNPSDVKSDAPLRVLLARILMTLDGAVAVVSGRSLKEIDRIFSPLSISAAGSHGTEIRCGTAPVAQLIEEPPVMEALEARIVKFVAGREGLLLERKAGGFTLHFRARPELDVECRTLMNEIAAELGPQFTRQSGKMIHEVVARNLSKGAAIEYFLQRAPFADHQPVFIGDDTTDEAGYRAVNAAGGLSIKVGTSTETAATYSLQNVSAVREWLSR